MLGFQNSKNGHNSGQEAGPEMFIHLFMQEISRLIFSPYREGLKRLILMSFSKNDPKYTRPPPAEDQKIKDFKHNLKDMSEII